MTLRWFCIFYIYHRCKCQQNYCIALLPVKFGINAVVVGKIVQKHKTVLRYFDTLTMDQGQGALIII